jgi:hypothetical protein
MMLYSRETVIILNWTKLPSDIKDIVKDDHRFNNDTYMEHISEFQPSGDETWQDTLVESNFHDYHNGQTETNDYTKSFAEFLSDYGLIIDWWLKDQPFDFSGVKRIFFHVGW